MPQPSDRRPSRDRPPGSSRPGRRTTARPRPVATPAAPGTARPEARRPRFTGRAAVLVLVLAVLMVSYASSLKAYFQQRSHIDDLKAQISTTQADIDRMQQEKQRWDDPAYVKEQARARLGYLVPGQTSYVVLGEDGKPLDTTSTLGDPSQVIVKDPTPWWTTAYKSVELAGNPPPPASKQKPPATLITAPTP